MRTDNFIARQLVRFPLGAAIGYLAVVVACVAATLLTITDVLDRRAAVAATADILSQLEGRKPATIAGANSSAIMTGSPVLEGPTVTVAGANLLQRVAGAVTRFGGNIVSSQVDLQGPQAKDGFVVVSISCEIAQTAMQQLLYDLESGMPFLFVDQLLAQAPAAESNALGGKMRVLISVSGQWQGAK